MGSGFDPNDIGNLAGVPEKIHRQISGEWNSFRHDNPHPTMQKVLEFVRRIEKEYGSNFMRGTP